MFDANLAGDEPTVRFECLCGLILDDGRASKQANKQQQTQEGVLAVFHFVIQREVIVFWKTLLFQLHNIQLRHSQVQLVSLFEPIK